MLQLGSGGGNQRRHALKLFHYGRVLAGQQKRTRILDGFVEFGLSSGDALGFELRHGLLDLRRFAVGLLAGFHYFLRRTKVALDQGFPGFLDGGAYGLNLVLLGAGLLEDGGKFIFAREGLGLGLEEANRFIELAGIHQTPGAGDGPFNLFGKLINPLLGIGQQDLDLLVGRLLHAGFKDGDGLVKLLFRDEALGLFGGGIYFLALGKADGLLARQLQQLLNFGRAFDLGGGAFQNPDRAIEIFLAAGIVGPLDVIALNFFGFLLFGAVADNGEQRTQAALARQFLRSLFQNRHGLGGFAGIEQLARRSHLLFHKFLALAGFASLFRKGLELEQARIVGEPLQRLIHSGAGSLIVILGERVFNLVGEFFQVFALGFLVAPGDGEVHERGDFGAGGINALGLFQNVEGGGELALRDVSASLIEHALQLLLLRAFCQLL